MEVQSNQYELNEFDKRLILAAINNLDLDDDSEIRSQNNAAFDPDPLDVVDRKKEVFKKLNIF